MATTYLTSHPLSAQLLMEVSVADDRTVTLSWDTVGYQGRVVHHSDTYRPIEMERGAISLDNAIYIVPENARRDGRTVWYQWDADGEAPGPMILLDNLNWRCAQFVRIIHDGARDAVYTGTCYSCGLDERSGKLRADMFGLIHASCAGD